MYFKSFNYKTAVILYFITAKTEETKSFQAAKTNFKTAHMTREILPSTH